MQAGAWHSDSSRAMTRPVALLGSLLCVALAACGPTSRNGNGGGGTDGGSQPMVCNPGDQQACYDGTSGTSGVGPCHGGMQTCTAGGVWGACDGEVTPVQETCGDGVDNNCNGMTDEDVDADGDGYTTCGGDCCDSTECSDPKSVNPGAYDVAGDGVDNDCDGTIDNTVASCDQGLSGTSSTGMDYAKAMDICQSTTMNDPMKRWGVIDATFTKADGTGSPNAKQHAILKQYGTGVQPHAGVNVALFSTGAAAGKGDPNFDAGLSGEYGGTSAFPADFLAANGGKLPNAPSCPAPLGNNANDPLMLTMHVRVPTNASSFSLDINFFSDEFPEYTCTEFNDFFVVLLDSTYMGTGSAANPTDKNLAFYSPSAGKKYPVGVNLASGNTGLFTQCVNGTIGCDGLDGGGSISTCMSTAQLAGTGLDAPAPDSCDSNSLMGGGTGWLTTTGNVTPGEIMTLRIAIWDTSDDALDSLAVIDNFKWSAQASNPGTVIQ